MSHSLSRLVPVGAVIFAVACGGSSDGTASPGVTPSPVPSPSSCAVTVSGLPTLVPGEGGSYPFSVAAPSGCAWTAQTGVEWATIAPLSGQGNATPRLTVAANATPDGRSVDVLVNTQTTRVTQNNGCTFTLTPTSLAPNANGGTASVTLTVLAGCRWTASTTESWIRTLTPGGSGSATVSFDVDPNPGTGVRHGFVTVVGRRVDVAQDGR